MPRTEQLARKIIASDVDQLTQQAEQLFLEGNLVESAIIYQKVAIIHQQHSDIRELGSVLRAIARIYFAQGQYEQSISLLNQALEISRKLNDQNSEAAVLNNLGLIYASKGEYANALSFYYQSLNIYQQTDSRIAQADLFDNIGAIYYNLARYSEALSSFQEALEIRLDLESSERLGVTLSDLGFVNFRLGRCQQAIELFQRAVDLLQAPSDAVALGFTYQGIGYCHVQQGHYAQAVTSYEVALEIFRDTGEIQSQGITLSDLGRAYILLQQYSQAIINLEKALEIAQQIEDRPSESISLNRLGQVNNAQGSYLQAFTFYKQSLMLSQEIGDRDNERTAFNNLGDLFAGQNQPELAIIFYKRSINITESIRQDIEGLPIEYQQSYTNTIADTYRKLADLLLQQDRVLEAQQVLDLLKVQELDDYLHQVRGNEETAQGIDLLPQEQSVVEQFDRQLEQAIELGRELSELEAIPREERTSEQEQRLLELREVERETLLTFNDFLQAPDVQALIQQVRQSTAGQNIEPRDLISLQRNLRELNQNVVLLYPLILEDRLELVISTPYTPPIHRSVPVGRVELNQAIAEFRSALGDPDADVEPIVQRLYDWLIRPIENELEQSQAQTILYAPDGQLRYIPLAALHDGNQWLVEKLRINNITALSLTNLNVPSHNQPQVLAAAFANGRYNIELRGSPHGFSGLPFSEIEVEALAKLFPHTTQLIDQAFTRRATLPYLDDYNIVHFATHAMFVTGQPEDSFILLGDGDRITLRDIDEVSLDNVDLMVLSGCQTGIGALGNGEEILGFGYQIQEAGARSAIASLWQVDDGGTEVLMSQFYTLLQQGDISKAAALQQAQIALIRGEAPPQQEFNNTPQLDTQQLTHPYY